MKTINISPDLAVRLAYTFWGNVLIHVLALAQDHHWAFHLKGIGRACHRLA